MGLTNLSTRVRLLLLLLAVFGCGVVFVFAEGQDGTTNNATANQYRPVTAVPSQASATPSNAPVSGSVRLSFPAEVELKVIVDYVSQRLGMKILYDEEIANKKVSLRAPGEVPVESLLGVLQSALKMKGLALVDAEVPGWKRIVVSFQPNTLEEIAGRRSGRWV